MLRMSVSRAMSGGNGAKGEARRTMCSAAASSIRWPEERFYYRSDHYNFAEKGVPVLFFFNGTHEDYHGVDDEIEKVDTEKAARIVKLMFYLGLEIANNPERPKWKQTG